MKNNTIKDQVRQRYSKIALAGSSDCCSPECCSSDSPANAATAVGYDAKDLEAVPQGSIIGAGCGAPVGFADIQKGETIVDLGSGAGIDVFLSANRVGMEGKVIGIDMTDEMLERARRNAADFGYSNVEFRKGDIESGIPVEDNTVDLVISNCVINLTVDKTSAFKEVYRILKSGGRMVVSDLVADRKKTDAIDPEKWSSCIDGALAKEDYLAAIRSAGFSDIQVLEERVFANEQNSRKISSVVIRTLK